MNLFSWGFHLFFRKIHLSLSEQMIVFFSEKAQGALCNQQANRCYSLMPMFTSCMTLGNLLNLSIPQFPNL